MEPLPGDGYPVDMAEVRILRHPSPLVGWLATPEGSGPWPGVVVVHDAIGYTGDARDITDRMARAGLLAVVPDLYDGRGMLRCIRSAFRSLAAREGKPFDDLETARAWLAARPDCTGQVGIIGFCMGGGFALLCAPRGFQASSVNYGEVPPDAEQVLAGACPIIGSFGGRDLTLRGHPERLEAALGTLGIPHDVKAYPDANHSFLNHVEVPVLGPLIRIAGLRYHEPSADDAWKRIFAFFDQHLSSTRTDAQAP